MKARRIIVLLVALAVFASVFVGCNAKPTQEQNTEEQENVEVTKQPEEQGTVDSEELLCRYLVPGDQPEENKMVDEAITAKMKSDGLNINFQRTYIAWDVWQQKTNVMLSTGEEYELIHIMEDWITASEYMARGGLTPITEYIDQYGAALKEVIPDYVWEAASIKGEIYSIPVMYRDFAPMSNNISIQKQLFDENNLPIPKTLDELVESSKIIMENHPELNQAILLKLNKNTDSSYHREYESFPFVVRESLFYIDQEGNVEPWLETEEFKQDCEFFNNMYESGLINPDVLTLSSDQTSQESEQGNFVFSLSTSLFALESIRTYKPEIEMVDILINPEKVSFRGEWVFMNDNAVPSTTTQPEAGVMFFNWLYSNQENYDLVNYGIKDQHWKEVDDGRYDLINPENPKYQFGDWEIGHYQFVRLSSTAPEELKPIMKEYDPDAVNAISAGFKFNPDPVSAEYSSVVAELESSIYPLKYGVVSYADGYNTAIEAMKAAGYETVVNEFRSQFEQWLAGR